MTFPSRRLRRFLWLYKVLWTLGLPLALTYLAYRSRKDPLYRQHLAERFGRYPDPLPGAVWVHAVSLGELRSAVPLIRRLLAEGESVVTTHFTPAGRREAEAVFADDIAAGRLRARVDPAGIHVDLQTLLRRFSTQIRVGDGDRGLAGDDPQLPCAEHPALCLQRPIPAQELRRGSGKAPMAV